MIKLLLRLFCQHREVRAPYPVLLDSACSALVTRRKCPRCGKVVARILGPGPVVFEY